jgi:hypothetical protein
MNHLWLVAAVLFFLLGLMFLNWPNQDVTTVPQPTPEPIPAPTSEPTLIPTSEPTPAPTLAPTPLQVQKEDLGNGEWSVSVPRGGWYDTGIPVPRYVYAYLEEGENLYDCRIKVQFLGVTFWSQNRPIGGTNLIVKFSTYPNFEKDLPYRLGHESAWKRGDGCWWAQDNWPGSWVIRLDDEAAYSSNPQNLIISVTDSCHEIVRMRVRVS